ncbi:MAG: hypothetical protein HKN44_07255 [Ilumatobacter sp.]|nr:hypothetical protein [Ilumatobacter sp.]
MTDQHSDTRTEAVINDAVSVIDEALAKMMARELVSGGEVADLLLDVRTLLTTDVAAEMAADVVPMIEAIEPVASDLA